MHSETANGEKPALTSLVGASAAPSQTPAARPQITPKPCKERFAFSVVLIAMNEDQQRHAQRQDYGGNPELNIREDGPDHRFAASFILSHYVTAYDGLR